MLKRRFVVPVVWRSFANVSTLPSATAASRSMPSVRVPAKIKRKPTDLLKALASTVKDDPTGNAYAFVDDPLFTPIRPLEVQNFAVSKELGRKAARYFAAQYPTLFMYDEDEPRLSAFRPVQMPRTENADDEASLNDRIDRMWVKSAMAVYENAVAKQHPISTPTRLKLLELLAFFNHEEPDTDLPESPIEIWYRSQITPPPKAAWTDDGLAMKIYDTLPEPKDPRATAAIICGMLKHMAVEKGYELWQLTREAGGEQGKLKDARVYEALIKYGVERLMAVNSERWDLVLEIFKAMAEDGVKPTVQIFNAAFSVLSKASRWSRTEQTSKQLMQEMLRLGIKPSLGTFYFILSIHQYRDNLGSILHAILTYIENNSAKLTLEDKIDGKFFVEAMRLSCDTLHDKAMAFRIHRLLKSGDNYLLLTDGMDEHKYYRVLLQFLSITEDTNLFYERYYKAIVPRYCIPDVRLCSLFLANIEVSGDYKYLSNVCADIIGYGLAFRRELIWEFLNTALRTPVYQMTPEIKEGFVRMAKDIYQKIESQYIWVERSKAVERKRSAKATVKEAPEEDAAVASNSGGRHNIDNIRLEWTSDLIASLAVMCARGGAPEEAWALYSRVVPPTEEELTKNQQGGTIIGEVPEQLALEMLDYFVKQKRFDQSYGALRVVARGRKTHVIKESAKKIQKSMPTNAVQLAKLEQYLNVWSDEGKQEEKAED